jgi:hypothetical protein
MIIRKEGQQKQCWSFKSTEIEDKKVYKNGHLVILVDWPKHTKGRSKQKRE